MSNQSQSEERRSSERKSVELPVTVMLSDIKQPVKVYTADLSAGGMFVALRRPPPVGTLVRFWLDTGDVSSGDPSADLPELVDDEEGTGAGEIVQGIAHVAWIRLRSEGVGKPNGMGLEYRVFKGDGKARVLELLEKL